MSTFWIFVVISCCFSLIFGQSTGKLLVEVSSGVAPNQEVQDDKYNSNVLSEADIVKDVLTWRDIDPLNTLPSSCPKNVNANVIYTIKVFGLEPFQVLCNSDLAGPGWTVIASRSNKEMNFFRHWQDYKDGFGNLTGDFFIGLEKLHAITVSQAHELYVYLEDFEGNKRFARYDEFLIGTETDKYVMAKLGTYVGNAGDSLSRHKYMKFSTLDNENDTHLDENCAVERKGAWWYKDCSASNLFGLYLNGQTFARLDAQGMVWHTWRGGLYSYKVMRMMVRPKCSCSL